MHIKIAWRVSEWVYLTYSFLSMHMAQAEIDTVLYTAVLPTVTH
jgi:hypothetical protein